MKPNTFHKVFCNTGIVSEGLTRVTTKTARNIAIAKPNMQQVQGHFHLEEKIITKYVNVGLSFFCVLFLK